MSTELLSNLTEWSENIAKIAPSHFDCENYANCARIPGGLGRGTSAMMSFIGTCYGEPSLDEGFRLMIVGMDHGCRNESGSYEERTLGIYNTYQNTGGSFNPHYRGVIKTAAAIVGRSASYCSINCKSKCAFLDNKEQHNCVMDRVIQANLVKCVPDSANSRESKTNAQMKSSCSNHLISEIIISNPNLIAVHGKAVHWAFEQKLRELGDLNSIWERGSVRILYSSYIKTHLLMLHHPTRGWLDRQWDTGVVPAIQKLVELKVIPPRA